MDTIKNFRAYRSKKLENIARIIAKTGITANHLTFLSFCSGLGAIYFLFSNYYFFTLFAMLHLVFDGLDGVIARITKPTLAGKYFDLLSDSIVTFLIIVKAGYYLHDFYAYLAAALFMLALLIHLKSKLQAFMLFMRTVSLIFLVIITHPLFPFTSTFLIIGYLGAGGVSLYSLSRQLQWYMRKR
ncbi:MAG TPA: CDP-alcohol phosphatidyltransferase family protein [Candidatus Nanoarchaeia archaeon]|nr:CDP-alcohol phosphatidyltransferase family protein [Candidatus Nanoarchaeia archaeon]